MLRIGRVAAQTGLTRKTLRFYEDEGLVCPKARSPGGFRLYDEHNLARIHFILQAKALGFTLAEIQRVRNVREAGESPCRLVRQLLHQKHREVQQSIARLDTLCRDLTKHLAHVEAELHDQDR
jgi:DNA-binding transcriptional MerR regulator